MGSSSGSAVSVAAGFSPIAIGTETDGSVVQPAARAAVFALKTTCEIFDPAGMQSAAPSMDTLGGFAKTSQDLANLMGVLMGDATISEPLTGDWTGKSVGVLDYHKWDLPASIIRPEKSVDDQKVTCERIRCRPCQADYSSPPHSRRRVPQLSRLVEE